jgi:hypothetical protein
LQAQLERYLFLFLSLKSCHLKTYAIFRPVNASTIGCILYFTTYLNKNQGLIALGLHRDFFSRFLHGLILWLVFAKAYTLQYFDRNICQLSVAFCILVTYSE